MFRRMGTVGQALVATLVVGGGLGYAVAQEGSDSTLEVVEVEPIGAPAAQEALSPAAQAKGAEAAVASAAANCAAQSRALQNAKREKDIIRATCLDDKLSQCNANLQNIKRRELALNEEVDLFAPDENPAVITAVPDWPIPYIPPPVSGVN